MNTPEAYDHIDRLLQECIMQVCKIRLGTLIGESFPPDLVASAMGETASLLETLRYVLDHGE